MSKRLLSYDRFSKIKTFHDYDHATKKTHISEEQDAQPILEINKKLRSTPEYRQHGYKEDMMHFARIPNNIVVEWKKKYNVDVFNRDDEKKVERLLNGDYKYLKTVDRI